MCLHPLQDSQAMSSSGHQAEIIFVVGVFMSSFACSGTGNIGIPTFYSQLLYTQVKDYFFLIQKKVYTWNNAAQVKIALFKDTRIYLTTNTLITRHKLQALQQ